MKNIRLFHLTIILLCCLSAGCKNPDEKVAAEKQKAAVSVEHAQQNVEKVRDKSEKRIEDAQGAAVDEAKIKATADIAKTQNKVDDAKISATENVTNAEQKAKADPSPEVP